MSTAGARIVAVPVAADERVVGVIRAEQSTAASQSRSRRIFALRGALAVGVLIVGGAIGYVLADRLAQPVRRLRDAAALLGMATSRSRYCAAACPSWTRRRRR